MLKLMGKKIITILRVYFIYLFIVKNSGVPKVAASGGRALQSRMGGKWLAEIKCGLKEPWFDRLSPPPLFF